MPSTAATAAAIRHLPIGYALRTALSLGIAATMWAGCGGGAGDRGADAASGDTAARTTARSSAAAPATSSALPARREFEVCALAPQAEVDAALKQAGVSSTVTRAGGSGGQCSYRSADGVASLLLEVTDYQTAERAQQSFDGQLRMAAERKYSIQNVTGIGDQGAISDQGESAGFKARKGAVLMRANLKLRRSSREQRQQAVEALGRMLVSRLPSP